MTVTVIDGTPDLSNRRHVLNGSDAVVLRYEKDTWVIRQGRRARIDSSNRAVLLPLGLTPEHVSQARPMSRALYDALPVGPELAVPRVPGAGQPAAFANAPGPVGTVIVTPQISGPQQYSVVLADGVQTVNPRGRPDPAERRHPGGQFTDGGGARVVGEDAGGQRAGPVGLPRRPAEPGGPARESGDMLVVAEDRR